MAMIGAPAIKCTTQGLLIYLTMGLYLLAFVARMLRLRRPGWVLYSAGFGVAVASVVYRGWHAGHFPLSNMFEVLLFVGMLMPPLSLLCRAALRVGIEGGDMMIAAVVLFAPGFVFDAEPKRLMPALQSPLFVPHVTAYMIAYAVLAKAGVQAAAQLITRQTPGKAALVDYERRTHRVICLGFPVLTAGLILGAWWGKIAWGDWWNWDPKEMWSLAGWLTYVLYFHVRSMYGRRARTLTAVISLLGVALIIITLLWANLSRLFGGLHSYA